MSEIKKYINVAELSVESLPWHGDMPDVAMAYPWIHDSENKDSQNQLVWPYRLFLGAEDDPNRANVAEWVQVDDLAGLENGVVLWAGSFNNTIYLHAGKTPPTNAEKDDDASGVIVASNSTMPERWKNGEPVLPFLPVPQESREEILKNRNGKWRRLIWEPIGLFDVAPVKKIYFYSAARFVRYTLWMIVEHPYVCFFTTKADIQADIYKDGAQARWPFTYYEKMARVGQPDTYSSSDNDGGFATGYYDRDSQTHDIFSNGYRLAPLPWQIQGNSEVETEEEFEPYDGVQQGQFYTLAPAYPCPRYLATAADASVHGALVKAYQQDPKNPRKYFEIGKDEAKKAIVETIRKTATQNYSVDPALFEEKGRFLPPQNGESVWQTDPPPYETIFSLHLDGNLERWPHWLAVMACHAPTALLIASACTWYNDFRPTEGWSSDSVNPDNPDSMPPTADENDPNDTPPWKEDGGGSEGGGGSGGGGGGDIGGGGDDGYRPDDEDGNPFDDEETDDDEENGNDEMPSGYYYEAGSGVQIKREYIAGDEATMPGWKHTIHVDDIAASGSVMYDISLKVEAKADSKTYPYAGLNYNMLYILEANRSQINVYWKSAYGSGSNSVSTATSTVSTPSSFTAKIEFDDLIVTSERSPDFGGNVVSATKTRTFTKRGTYKIWDKMQQRWAVHRFSRSFDVYTLAAKTGIISPFVQKYATVKAPNRAGSYAPAEIKGSSTGMDGPAVIPVSVSATSAQGTASELMGDFSATIIADYEECSTTHTVSGSNAWQSDNGPGTGSITGSFTATLSQKTEQFEI